MNDDGKSYLKQLKDIRFIMFDICRCTIEGLPKAFDEIKESLERLEKLEKVVEILNRDKEFTLHKGKEPILGTDEYKFSFVNWKSLTKEEYQLFEEVFGE